MFPAALTIEFELEIDTPVLVCVRILAQEIASRFIAIHLNWAGAKTTMGPCAEMRTGPCITPIVPGF